MLVPLILTSNSQAVSTNAKRILAAMIRLHTNSRFFSARGVVICQYAIKIVLSQRRKERKGLEEHDEEWSHSDRQRSSRVRRVLATLARGNLESNEVLPTSTVPIPGNSVHFHSKYCESWVPVNPPRRGSLPVPHHYPVDRTDSGENIHVEGRT